VQLADLSNEQLLGKMLLKVHSGAKLAAEIWAANGGLFSIEFSSPPRSDLGYSDIEVLEFEQFPKRERPRIEMLPLDYPDLSSSSKLVLSFDRIYDVKIEVSHYWILAEVPDLGLLGVKQRSSDRVLYFLPYGGEYPTNLGASLAKALAVVTAGPD